jgi:hypothetical protein
MVRKKRIVRDPRGFEVATEEEEEDGILQDGQSVRVPLYLKDGATNPALNATQRAVAEDKAARSFGLNDALALHKPGFRDARDSSAIDRLEQAYRAADLADAERYKSLQRWGANDANKVASFGGAPKAGAYPVGPGYGPADRCTVDGRDGRLVEVAPGWLECRPVSPDAQTVDQRELEYALYDERCRNAWKHPT